jgi:(p)ppGpp synthase/HD superfamily hydrolase
MNAYSPRFDAALCFAASAHRTQARKGSGEPGVPYIIHPVHVAMILVRHGFDEDTVIAGVLHDTVEDTDASIGDVRTQFGDAVATIVAGVTEQKEEGGQKRPWRVRKEEQLAHLAHGGRGVAAVKAADALHNASATLADLQKHGRDVWSRFNAAPSDSVWYYRELARLCGTQLGADSPIVRELTAAVEALAQTV